MADRRGSKPRFLVDVGSWSILSGNRYELKVGTYTEALRLVEVITKRFRDSICFQGRGPYSSILCLAGCFALHIVVEPIGDSG